MRITRDIFRRGAREDAGGRPLKLLIGRLFEQQAIAMKRFNQKFSVWRRTMKDGTRIVIATNMNGPLPIRTVKVDYEVAGEEFGPFDILSGLFVGLSYKTDMDSQGYFDVVDIVERAGGGWYRTGWQNNEFLLGSLNEWPGGGHDNNPCALLSDSSWRPAPYQYSGAYGQSEMAKVAQLLFGMGVACPYRYCWERSHAIFTGSDGSKYVIEVSVEDGITAWALDTEPAGSPEDTGMDLTYLPVPVTSVPDVGDRIELASASDMSTYAGQDYHFRECGWSFDASGHNGINTSWDVVTDGGLTCKKGYLWRISITESNNAPASATITQDREDWLYNNVHSQVAAKFPLQTGPCFKSLYLIPASGTPSGDLKAPVLAYYDDDDNEIIVSLVFKEPINDTVDTKPAGATLGCTLPTYGAENTAGSYRKGQDLATSATWFEVEGMDRELEVPDRLWTSRAVEIDYSWEQLGGWVNTIYLTKIGVASEHWRLHETQTEYDYPSRSYNEQLFIYHWVRRGFAIFQSRSNQDAAIRTEKHYMKGHCKGTFYAAGTCPASATREAYWISSQGHSDSCGCGGGTAAEKIGWWVWQSESSQTISDYVACNSIPFKAPKADPNNPIPATCQNDILCYETARTGCEDDPATSDCRLRDPAAVGNCSSSHRYSEVDFTEEYASDGYTKMNFYYNGQVTQLIDDVYNLSLYQPYWKRIDSVAVDGCQYLDAQLDAFTGAGTVAVNISTPMTFATRVVLENADLYYALDEINNQNHGYFGVPYPEIFLGRGG